MSEMYDDEELMGDYTSPERWPSPEELETMYPGIWDDPRMRDWLLKKADELQHVLKHMEGQP